MFHDFFELFIKVGTDIVLDLDNYENLSESEQNFLVLRCFFYTQQCKRLKNIIDKHKSH